MNAPAAVCRWQLIVIVAVIFSYAAAAAATLALFRNVFVIIAVGRQLRSPEPQLYHILPQDETSSLSMFCFACRAIIAVVGATAFRLVHLLAQNVLSSQYPDVGAAVLKEQAATVSCWCCSSTYGASSATAIHNVQGAQSIVLGTFALRSNRSDQSEPLPLRETGLVVS